MEKFQIIEISNLDFFGYECHRAGNEISINRDINGELAITIEPQENKNTGCNDFGKCRICFIERVSQVFIPCFHAVVCTYCSKKWRRVKCFICRGRILKRQQLYFDESKNNKNIIQISMIHGDTELSKLSTMNVTSFASQLTSR